MTTENDFRNYQSPALSKPELNTAVSIFLNSATYDACLLLIHPDISRLKKTAAYLSETYQWAQLSIGSTLSQALLPLTPKQRSRMAEPLLSKLVKTSSSDPLILTDIDILFEPTLLLNPLILLRRLSRQVKVIVTWPGTYQGGTLAYAVPEHAHFRIWNNPDLPKHCLISI